ncbi:hypothetical protein C8Q70DRAFT_541060 [Cubamyces menziesii]|nr:hypothetical protein C8Q70DRAFT_541060 [Cubamyces menziesii]
MDYLKDQINDAYANASPPPARTSSTPVSVLRMEDSLELCGMTPEEAEQLQKEMDDVAKWEESNKQAADALYQQIVWRPKAFPALPPPQRYQVPLPSDTDSRFKINISVSGQLGMKLECEGTQSNLALITQSVDNATLCLDEEISGPVIWTQRVYFATEAAVKMTPTPTPKDPLQEYTLAHLIALLLVKQRRHLASLKPDDRTLQYFVGTDAIPPQGNCTISRSSLYATAIRRRLLQTGMWCYFLQLEIRV